MAWLTRSFLTLGAALLLSAPAMDAAAQELRSFKSAQPVLGWAKSLGENDKLVDEIDGISVDNNGNTILSGIFKNKLAWNGKTYASRGEGDVFLTSIAPNGKVNWTRHIGGSGDDNTFDTTTDRAGNIYISGWFNGTVDFGGQSVTSRGGSDMFLAKYTPAGGLTWVKGIGGKDEDGGNEISVLDNGEIAVSAMTNGQFEVDGKTYPFGGGQRDAFLIRMSPSGAVKTVTHFGGPGMERIRAVAMAPSGDTYLGFTYRGVMDTQGFKLKSRGKWDGAAARVDNSGKVLWLLPVGSKGDDNVRGIGVGPGGEVYASGVIGGAGVLFGRKVPALGRKGDDYVVRLSPSGKMKFIVSLAGPGNSIGPELQADRRGVLLSALHDGPLTIRNGKKVIAQLDPPSGLPTSYVVAFDTSGNLRFKYSPSPRAGKSGAFGDVLSVSRNGKYLVQALRYRGNLRIGKTEMSTPAKMDSAVVFLKMNGS